MILSEMIEELTKIYNTTGEMSVVIDIDDNCRYADCVMEEDIKWFGRVVVIYRH